MPMVACGETGTENEPTARAETAVLDTYGTAEDPALPEDMFSDEEEAFSLPPIPDDLTGGKPWIDSCVAGNVTTDTETSAVDDFYLYVNKDWIASNEIPEGSPTLEFDLTVEPRARMQKALAGDALSGHDAHQAQLLYRTIVDTDLQKAVPAEEHRGSKCGRSRKDMRLSLPASASSGSTRCKYC